MKLGRKLVAFLAVFLTIFNSGFAAITPVAHAMPTFAKIVVHKIVVNGNPNANFPFKIKSGGWSDSFGLKDGEDTGSDYAFVLPGSYTITETPVTNYDLIKVDGGTVDLANKQTVLPVAAGGTYHVYFYNAMLSGSSVTVSKAVSRPAGKTDSDNTLFGYTLTGTSTKDGTPYTVFSRTGTVGEDPSTNDTYSNLPVGNYTLTEDAAPANSGYTNGNITINGVTKSTFSVSGNSSYTAVINNTKKYSTGTVTIQKAVTKAAGEAADSQAFAVDITGVKNGVTVYSNTGVTIRETAPIQLTGLPYGSYTVHEPSSVAGYANGADVTFTIDDSTVSSSFTKTLTNTKYEGSATVTKTLTGGSGTFTIRIQKTGEVAGGSASQTFSLDVPVAANTTVTSATVAQLARLPLGQYTVSELNAPNYSAGVSITQGGSTTAGSTFSVTTANYGSTVAINVTNTKLTGVITVSKTIDNFTNGDTGTFLFDVYRGEITTPDASKFIGNVSISFPAGGTFATRAMPLGAALDYGKYTVFETNANANGYITAASRQVVDLQGAAATATFHNTKVYGEVSVTKTMSDAHNSANNTDFTVRISGNNGYSHDVTIHRGQTIGKAADAALGRLPVGHYTVTELDAAGNPLFGYTSQITPNAFDVVTTAAAQAFNIAVANTKLYGNVTVNKTIGNFAAGDTGSFEFKLYSGELTAPDESKFIESESIVFPAGGTDAARSIGFDTALGYGKYTIFETDASGYVAADSRKVVNLTSSSAAASFTNTKVYGEVTVAKTLADAANPSSAAQFTVRIAGNNGYTQDVPVGNGDTVSKANIPALGRLPVGHYTVTELDAAGNPLTGYSSVINHTSFDIITTADPQVINITVDNTKLYGGVNVTNNVTDSLNVPAGMVTSFDITIAKTGDGADGTPGEAFTRTLHLSANQTVTPTDAGYAFLAHLPLGQYTVTSGAPGYSTGVSVDGAPATSTFELTKDSHGILSVVVSHVRLYGSVNVTKAIQFDLASNDTFGFSISGGPAGWVAPANLSILAGGTDGWVGLPVGTYKVTELDKTGYEFLYFNDGTPVAGEKAVTVEITASNFGMPVNLSATNRKLGSITLTKDVIGATGDTTEFGIHITGPSYPNGHDVTLTQAGGAVPLNDLKYGTYTITETIPADKTGEYRLDNISSTDGSTGSFANGTFTVTIGMGADEELNPITSAVTVSNLKFAAIDLTKLDSVTGKAPVGSSTFRVEKLVREQAPAIVAGDTAEYVGTITTDPATGKGSLGSLEPGRYRVTETGAPAGYDFAAPQEFTVEAGQTAPLTFVNVPHGWLKIVKTDSDTGDGIDGVTFQLAAAKDESGNLVGTDAFPIQTYTTANGGLIPNDGGIKLVKGTYYLKETAAPAGYVVDGTVRTVAIELNETNTQRITNDAQSYLHITVNSVQGGGVGNVVLSVQRQQPNAFLRAVEAIAGSSFAPFTMTTGADGTVLSNPLFPGRYTATMTSADPGWVLLDPLSQSADLTLGSTSSLTFLVRPEGSVVVTKMDSLSEAPLAGVNFELSADNTFAAGSEKFAATTIADGTASFEHLLPGNYFVREVSAAPGYGYNPNDVRPVTVVRAEATPVAFANDPVGYLRIANTDSLFSIPVGGAPFGIYASQAAADADTGDTGAGALQKVNAAANGIILSGPLALTGDTTTFFVKQLATPAGYIANPTVYSASIALNDRINESGQPKPVNVAVPNVPLGNLEITKVDSLDATLKLTGASFDLFSNAALTAKVGSGTTDADGLTVIADLAPGDYWLVETKAPDGYVLNAAPIPLSLNPTPGHVNVHNGKWYEAVTVLDEANPPAGIQTGDLKLMKTDSLTGKRLPGATFKFFADAARTDLVAEETTDKNGEILIEGLDPATYYVVETKAPTDYVLNNTPVPVVVKADQVNPLNLVNEYNPPEGVQTGMMDYNIILGGIAVLLIGAGLVFFASRKRKVKTN